MSLATRCTSCGTIFRVVQDQLKVSEGWVRCGRCQQVFNALQNLFDLDREQAPPWPPVGGGGAPAVGGGAPAATATAATAPPRWDDTRPLDPAAGTRPAAPPAGPPATGRAATTASAAQAAAGPAAGATVATASARPAPNPAPAAASPRRTTPAVRAGLPGLGSPAASSQALLHTASREPEPAPAAQEADALSTQPTPVDDDDETSGFEHARFPGGLIDAEPPASAASAALAALHGAQRQAAAPVIAREPAPQFVRLAERAARWRQPRVRAALGLLLVLSVLALLAQIALQFRAPIAAAWPESRALLQPMCEWLDCSIGPPRRLDSLTVDASGLSRTASPGVYRLSVALHNHSHTVVMVPAIELSLTDAHGQLFARRALQPQDLGVTQPAIPAGGDLALQARLSTGAERVVGYTVEIFYP